jgi:hypothetical protein
MDLYRASLRGPFQDFVARKGWQDRWVPCTETAQGGAYRDPSTIWLAWLTEAI